MRSAFCWSSGPYGCATITLQSSLFKFGNVPNNRFVYLRIVGIFSHFLVLTITH